ncbi:MAG: 6-carboxytetrahydropterin synthase [Acidobacteriota bacterium]|nr:6-carboxytetrahydropterin synthase [Acidobacteriota bacterium]
MSDPREHYTVHLAKEDFKFSAAHFTLFPDGQAELLHGHNYQVELELTGEGLDGYGLLCDFVAVKGAIRDACERLDTRTLVPRDSPELVFHRGEAGHEEEDGMVVTYRDRRYVFPARDVLVLPVVNTSIELLARWLWHELAPGLVGSQVSVLGVSVAETAGQSCWYRAPVAQAAGEQNP